MAYVAISGEFVERVKTKIGVMYRAELSTLPKTDWLISPDSDFYLSAMWGEYQHLHKQIPSGWKRRADSLTVKFKVGETSCTHTFKLTDDGEAPPYHDNYRAIPVDANHPELTDAVAYYARKVDIDARWRSVEDKVVAFLQSCKSVNEAIKLWPDVAMYIDPKDIERMGVKRERAKESAALEALKQLDTDELVGAAVIARMSGAQV